MENLIFGEHRYIDLNNIYEGEEAYAKVVFTKSMTEIYINGLKQSFGGKFSKSDFKPKELV